jgi:hypothetical protein
MMIKRDNGALIDRRDDSLVTSALDINHARAEVSFHRQSADASPKYNSTIAQCNHKSNTRLKRLEMKMAGEQGLDCYASSSRPAFCTTWGSSCRDRKICSNHRRDGSAATIYSDLSVARNPFIISVSWQMRSGVATTDTGR